MTDQRLRELFNDLAETLPEGSSRAGELWRQGTRSRTRRRWTVAGAAAAVTVLVVAGIVVPSEPVERAVTVHPSGTPTPTISPAPARETAPPPSGETKLPTLATALPEKWADLPVVTAVPGPVLGVAQFGDGRIYLMKSGGRVPLDVKLDNAVDAGGNRGTPLKPNALAPDGTMAAFPQPDEVVVVDLVIGRARRYPVPGFNEVVLWRGEQLLVEQEEANYLLDLATGKVRRQPYKGFAGVAGYRDLRIVSPEEGGWTVIREGESEVELDVRDITNEGAMPVGVLDNHGWQRGGLVARSAFAGYDQGKGADVVVVADVATGRVVRTLRLPWGDPPGWRCGKEGCPVRGWIRQDTVIIESRDRLLGWNIATGALSRVADLPDNVTAYSLRGW
ncbi:hypothetical protein [Nonomuraea jiangxiensis]|uniref:Uncharacterized protein n=1 Tax=Nonomuraea jiangxiensis TaxID=633440 RepID=A0A1G9JEW2_9ACTN|nr:hypothetical protein [Nonomuraea jiangxiensis]SDL35693.1 hypothetical protein SAMN05421869_12511 [Nonomuraea jiangxiensis]